MSVTQTVEASKVEAIPEGHDIQYQAKYHSRSPYDEDRMLGPSHVQLSICSR
jgi:hypothetical protein